jgi:hypothetical protein
MPFCVSCGVRVEPGVERCAACQGRSEATRRCGQCGTPAGGPQSRFCIVCGAAMEGSSPATPAAATTAPATAATQPAATAHSSAATQAADAKQPSVAPQPLTAGPLTAISPSAPNGPLIESTRRDRQVIYQRLGRLVLSECVEGKISYDVLPEAVAQQIRGAVLSIRRGHVALASAGICPRCLAPDPSGDPPTCRQCTLILPVTAQTKAAAPAPSSPRG